MFHSKSLGFLMILLIESGVHKFFGGHNHSHFPSQDTLAKKMADVEVGNQLYKILSISIFFLTR